MDCWPPCSPWCVCIDGVCQPSDINRNAVRLRTPDGRYLQAANGGGGLLVAANVATPTQAETFLLAPAPPPASWPLASGSSIALDVCNASWAPSGLRVRVDHNVKTWPAKKGEERLVSYFVGGPGARVYVNAGFSAGYPAYPGSEKEPLEQNFDIVKVGGGSINNGDQVALRINSNFGQTFFFRTTGGQNQAEIHGDGTALGQPGTLFVVEFNEVRTSLGWRPPVVQCQTCATVTGTVTSAFNGLPLANAQVEALGVLENHPFSGTTANNGSFTLRDPEGRSCIPAGNVSLRAKADRHQTKTTGAVNVPGAGSINVPIQLDCTQVRGKVVDAAGLPVSGVVVMLGDTGVPPNPLKDPNGNAYIATTGPDGSFVFNCVEHRAAVVWNAVDGQSVNINVPPEGANVTIVVQVSCGNLVGRVTEAATGQPIQNAAVSVPFTMLQTTSDANGNFRFNCVKPAGTRTVVATAPGCQNGSKTGTVPTSGDSALFEIKLTCTAVVISAIIARLDWGVQPGDLDAHLSGPDGQGGRFHLFYSNRMNPPVPFVALDQDYTTHGPDPTSNTPETITITKPPGSGVYEAGDYHLWIHNFTGSTFDGSNAVLTVLTVDAQGNFSQVGRYEVVNATGTLADDLWHVVNLTVNANGNVFPSVIQMLQPGTAATVL